MTHVERSDLDDYLLHIRSHLVRVGFGEILKVLGEDVYTQRTGRLNKSKAARLLGWKANEFCKAFSRLQEEVAKIT